MNRLDEIDNRLSDLKHHLTRDDASVSGIRIETSDHQIMKDFEYMLRVCRAAKELTEEIDEHLNRSPKMELAIAITRYLGKETHNLFEALKALEQKRKPDENLTGP